LPEALVLTQTANRNLLGIQSIPLQQNTSKHTAQDDSLKIRLQLTPTCKLEEELRTGDPTAAMAAAAAADAGA
jgi:hypothetical protein